MYKSCTPSFVLSESFGSSQQQKAIHKEGVSCEGIAITLHDLMLPLSHPDMVIFWAQVEV